MLLGHLGGMAGVWWVETRSLLRACCGKAGRLIRWGSGGDWRRTYVGVDAPSTDEFLHVSDQVVPAAFLLDAAEPVWLPSADEELLGIWHHCSMQRLAMVDFESLWELGHGRAGASRGGT